MPSSTTTWSWLGPVLVLAVLLQCTPARAFGAGNIPSYAYLEGKAFRHGDIEDVLEELAKGAGGAAGMLGALTGGLLVKKWGGLDIKRVYFGNWLRDYSQAMDVAGLSKLSRQAIINLVMVLGFLAHGYATGEFEVTEERLGVYLPTEHIDNPKDYNDNKDARQVHPKLRPPIDPQELEIDPQSGMLNYIANERGHWDTSKAVARRTLLQCIDMGRRGKSSGGHEALYEAYRLLGTALHTLEDFPAHSNYCELALLKLGHQQIFCHVGSNVHVRAPNGHSVPPLVTGTFGGSDFIHSLLGEANDHISSASVSDLNKKVIEARSAPQDRGIDGIRDLLFQLPGGEGQSLSRDMDNVSNIRASTQDPMNMSPQELHAVLWQVLKFRDDVSKAIERTIEKIPGLGSLIEKLGNSIATFVFVTIEPYLKPVLQQATGVLQQGSAQVVNQQDQFRVWNDPNYAHPTHSLLAKDHFSMILNEPAGNLAKLIVRHTVKDVVKCWDDTSVNANQIVENLLTCLYHPHFNNGSPIQNEMEDYMRKWIAGEDRNYVLNALTRDAVKAHKNNRKGHKGDNDHNHGGTTGPMGYQSFLPTPAKLQSQATGYLQQQAQHIPGYQQFQHMQQSFPGRDMPGGGYDQNTPGSQYNQPSTQDPYLAGGAGNSFGYDNRPPHQPAYGAYQQQGPPVGYGGGYDQPSYGAPPPPPPTDFGGAYGALPQDAYAGPHGGSFGGPPSGGYGGPPPPHAQQPSYGGFDQAPGAYQDPNAFPGAQYQQHHGQSGGYSSGFTGQPPPPGRW